MNFIDFQEALQNLKKDKKIRQADIARGLETSTSNLSQKFNNPKSEVTISDMEKVQEYLDVKLYARVDDDNFKVVQNSGERQNDTTVDEKASQFGKRLSALQDKHNFLDKEMAKLLDVTEKTYISLVVGDKLPTFDILCRIKQNFKVSIDYLLFGD